VPSGTYALATANARIVAIPADAIDTTPASRFIDHTTNVFADNTTAVIVTDSDLSDAAIILTEVPLAPKSTPPTAPNNTQPTPDDPPQP
jgi:hypothetical protein